MSGRSPGQLHRVQLTECKTVSKFHGFNLLDATGCENGPGPLALRHPMVDKCTVTSNRLNFNTDSVQVSRPETDYNCLILFGEK